MYYYYVLTLSLPSPLPFPVSLPSSLPPCLFLYLPLHQTDSDSAPPPPLFLIYLSSPPWLPLSPALSPSLSLPPSLPPSLTDYGGEVSTIFHIAHPIIPTSPLNDFCTCIYARVKICL